MELDNLVVYDSIKQCVTLKGVAAKRGRHPTVDDLGVIEDAALVVDSTSDTIVWVGPAEEMPAEYRDVVNVFSSEGEIWLPELVECHTHLLYAGDRSHDYALRARGKTYQQVAESGGGILSTIVHTREASAASLVSHGHEELDRFQSYGVGVVEVKTGYGLSWESEEKLLRCIHDLQNHNNMILVPTFLPAHAVPPEFKGRVEDYVTIICKEWIPAVAHKKQAVFFDAFIEEGYFSVDQARRMAETALSHKMKLKFHSDQFKDIGGTALGVELGATSVDHLDHLSETNLKKLAKSDTVAVLCPGASLFTGTPFPPARRLIDEGARVALSTDYNPGTCPTRNLPMMTTIACSQMKMTVPESIAAVTYNAAAALGLESKIGSLEPGKRFRACQIKAQSYESLPYCFGELE